MSSEQILDTSDLRSAAQDTKRDAARKAKWGIGAIERKGRGEGNPRPMRPSDTNLTSVRRADKGVSAVQSREKVARKYDMLEGTSTATSDESSGTNSDNDGDASSPAGAATMMYSFDASRSPSHGSQILNTALAKAVEKYEERETVKLVKSEYDVLDVDGETVVSPVKKSKGKGKKAAIPSVVGTSHVADADEDWDLVD